MGGKGGGGAAALAQSGYPYARRLPNGTVVLDPRFLAASAAAAHASPAAALNLLRWRRRTALPLKLTW